MLYPLISPLKTNIPPCSMATDSITTSVNLGKLALGDGRHCKHSYVLIIPGCSSSYSRFTMSYEIHCKVTLLPAVTVVGFDESG